MCGYYQKVGGFEISQSIMRLKFILERCDGSSECEDESDELNCKTLYWSKAAAYSKEIPPPPPKGEEETNKTQGKQTNCKILIQRISFALLVTISATIMKILDIKELDGIWQPKVIFDMKWFDSRLLMQNLKDDIQLNVLATEERDLPWIPTVIFNNHKESARFLLDEKVSLVVRKEGEGYGNDYEDLDAAEIYQGTENPFLYSRIYSEELECDFDLRSYPFDTQACTIELRVPYSLETKVALLAEKINYNGSKSLSQFEVEFALNRTEDGKALFIILLNRKFAYHLVSVYIPSLSLLAISLSCL